MGFTALSSQYSEAPTFRGRVPNSSIQSGRLSFTASNLPELKILNRELIDVYNRHAKQGFAVYQVFLDTNKAQWIRSVSEQQLPWISVNDLQGGESPAVRVYNVQKIPANFLIDREGNIVRRDVAPTEIEAAVKELL